MVDSRALRAMMRFHWVAGARVALRANAMVLATVVFVFGSAPDGLATLRNFLLGVVIADRLPGSRLLLAAIAGAFAMTAVPRVTLGATGWMRALPVDARSSWRAAVAALCMAQMAVAFFIPACVLAVVFAYRATPSLSRVVSLPLMMVLVAAAVLPTRRLHTRVFAAVGVALAVVGTWPAMLGAVVVVAAADFMSPEIARVRKRTMHGARRATGRGSALTIWIRLSWRAMTLEAIAGTLILPVILASYAFFITRNNPEMPAHTKAAVVRVCGVLSVSAFAALLSNLLLRARQPWPWMRSLPWSSARRVVTDAYVIGVPLLIVPLALAAVSPLSALAVGSLVPLGAVAGAASIRNGAKRQTGAAGEVALIALPVGGLLAVNPIFVVVALAAVPVFVGLGSRRDRNAVASRWTELHHDASGDPGWLSGA